MNFFSISSNILVNIVGMAFVTLLTFIATPYYLLYLGTEAFGLIGFFYVFCVCISILDLGVSPFLQREVAKTTNKNFINEDFNKIVQIITIYFIFILIFINILSLPLSGLIINNWFTTDGWDLLPLVEVEQSIKLIFSISSLLMGVNLFKYGLTGYHFHYWLNIFLTFTAILRYVGSILLISIYKGNIVDFFIYQVLIALVELIVLAIKFYSQVPTKLLVLKNINITLLKKIFSETIKISTISILLIIAYQLDKVLLSKVIPLEEYAYFTLISIICSGIMLISIPVKRAIQPTFSILHLSKNLSQSIDLYRRASHLITIIVGAIVITICMYPIPIILFWTGNLEVSMWVSDSLYLFVIGAGLASIQSILLAFQEARGDLNLQIKLNFIFLLVQVPLMLFCVLYFGIVFKEPVIGIGLAWLAIRISSFIILTNLIHKTYELNLNKKWFLKDFFLVILIQVIVSLILKNYLSDEILTSLEHPILGVLFAGFIIIMSGFLSSHHLYRYIKNYKLIKNNTN